MLLMHRTRVDFFTTIISALHLVAEAVQREARAQSADPTAKLPKVSEFFQLNVTHIANLNTTHTAKLFFPEAVAYVYQYITGLATAGEQLLPHPTHVAPVTERISRQVSSNFGSEDAPLIDTFLIIYWAVSLTLFWLLANYILNLRKKTSTEKESDAEQDFVHHVSVSKKHIGGGHQQRGVPALLAGNLSLHQSVHHLGHHHIERGHSGENLGSIDEDDAGEQEEDTPTFELDANIWALNFVAAIGKAKYQDGADVSPVYTGAISIFMCLIQFAALRLMTGALYPGAHPWTTEPESPWLKGYSGATVNMMKFIMFVFLAVGQISEVSQSRRVVTVALATGTDTYVGAKYVKPWYRFIPIVGAILQYMVSVIVVWAGISTVLSFQTVPDIVYSSMSVVFLTSADEMFADMVMTIFDIQADFGIPLSTEQDKEADDLFPRQDVPLYLLLKFLQLFPAMFAGQLLVHAWYTGVMPNHRWIAWWS